MESPFITHRDKVLGPASADAWLRGVVLALWSGSDYPVGLSELADVDDDHMHAAVSMMQSYRRHGGNDGAFVALAKECLGRRAEENVAALRVAEMESWLCLARRELRLIGLRTDLVDEHHGWFAAQFWTGQTPSAAALRAKAKNLELA